MMLSGAPLLAKWLGQLSVYVIVRLNCRSRVEVGDADRRTNPNKDSRRTNSNKDSRRTNPNKDRRRTNPNKDSRRTNSNKDSRRTNPNKDSQSVGATETWEDITSDEVGWGLLLGIAVHEPLPAVHKLPFCKALSILQLAASPWSLWK
ncbi:uncharacterized protein N7473_004353 [Penicillium subrubescens]|uniref:uncharacterized protein n=1 Tax=Penicillium subrubescens TaxID=1316194 RepID=UPI0025459513|nr:uncharacterized protein N7473_004353 [Penicillium subrubescens]KAJ5900283.1 hypothetical protein N7473_004353 [Penicillium subrubescens]